MNFSAYIASPYGFSEAGRFYHSAFLRTVKDCGFTVLDPWTLTDEKIIRKAQDTAPADAKMEWQKVNAIIGKNNEDAIRQCHLLIAVCDGVDVDSGTASEIGAAAILGKAIEGYRGDLRLASGNVGCTVNLQVEYFIKKGGGWISRSLNELKLRLITRHNELKQQHS